MPKTNEDQRGAGPAWRAGAAVRAGAADSLDPGEIALRAAMREAWAASAPPAPVDHPHLFEAAGAADSALDGPRGRRRAPLPAGRFAGILRASALSDAQRRRVARLRARFEARGAGEDDESARWDPQAMREADESAREAWTAMEEREAREREAFARGDYVRAPGEPWAADSPQGAEGGEPLPRLSLRVWSALAAFRLWAARAAALRAFRSGGRHGE